MYAVKELQEVNTPLRWSLLDYSVFFNLSELEDTLVSWLFLKLHGAIVEVSELNFDGLISRLLVLPEEVLVQGKVISYIKEGEVNATQHVKSLLEFNYVISESILSCFNNELGNLVAKDYVLYLFCEVVLVA